ncbi:MAG: DUF6472 family protein [Oscillospiraceae bacterium]|jgi:hypothetical protein
MTLCEECAYYVEDEQGSYCSVNLDEDEAVKFLSRGQECPYYRNGDEYSVVRKQN